MFVKDDTEPNITRFATHEKNHSRRSHEEVATKERKVLDIGGDIASDLYGPQFWDDNFQFSFSVVVSCKSNKQLGYF